MKYSPKNKFENGRVVVNKKAVRTARRALRAQGRSADKLQLDWIGRGMLGLRE